MAVKDQKLNVSPAPSPIKLHNQKVIETLISILVLLGIVGSLPFAIWHQLRAIQQQQQQLDQIQQDVSVSKQEVQVLLQKFAKSFGIGKDVEDNIRKNGMHKPGEVPIKTPNKG